MKNHSTSSQAKPASIAITAVTLAFFASALVGIVLEFNRATYDWDIDHEMYFGQALWRGELLWSREFHDKLPVIQYFFAIPAFFESVTAWRVISVVFALSAAIVLIRFSPLLFGGSIENSQRSGWLAAGVYLTLFVSMPGGFTHINVVPASSALIALILMFRLFERVTSSKQLVVLSLLVAFFSTVSISIRPYFLFALAPAAIWLSVKFIFRSTRYTKATRVGIVAGLASAIVVFGFGANSLPYVLTGQTGVFLEGLRFLLSGLNPVPGHQSFLAQLGQTDLLGAIAWFTAAMLAAGVGWALLVGFRRQPGAHFFGILALSSSTLAISTLSERWWPHYSNFFSWYFAILSAGLIVALFDHLARKKPAASGTAQANVLIVSLLVAIAPLAVTGLHLVRAVNAETEHAETWRLEAITEYLDQNYTEPVSFLSPEHMYSHWKLGEPRHGFPHAANTLHIRAGWWEHTSRTDYFLSPKTSEEYCELLHQSSIEVVFVERDDHLAKCLAISRTTRGLAMAGLIGQGEQQLEVWVRKP